MFRFKKSLLFFIPALLLSLALLQAFNRKGREDPLSFGSHLLLTGLQTELVNLRNSAVQLLEKYVFFLGLRESHTRALIRNRELETRLKSLQEIQKENKSLRRLLDFPLREDFALLPAQITGTDLLAENGIFSVNKGTRHGVRKFMGVLHPDGVVGFVFRVGPRSAQVVSLLGAPASLTARNQRSRVRGLVTAGTKGLLVFNYPEGDFALKQAEALWQEGDKIVTAPSDPFPSGFPVGVLVDRSNTEEPTEIHIRPAVRFYALEEVFIILRLKPKFGISPNPKEALE